MFVLALPIVNGRFPGRIRRVDHRWKSHSMEFPDTAKAKPRRRARFIELPEPPLHVLGGGMVNSS